MNKTKRIKIVALIFPGITLVILLLFAIGETVGEDWSGLGHLAQAIPIAVLMWLGWKSPLWGGIFLTIMGILALSMYANAFRNPNWLAPFLIIVAPMLIAGLLLLFAFVLERKNV